MTVTYTPGSGVTATGSTTSLTASITCNANDTIIVFVKTNNGSTLVTPTVTYSNGGTVSALGAATADGGNAAYGAMFAFQIANVGGSGTITSTSTLCNVVIDAAAYSSLASVTAYSTTANVASSLSISATNVANGLVIADFSGNSSAGTVTSGTARVSSLADSSGAGSQTISWSCGYTQCCAIVAVLNPVGLPSQTPPIRIPTPFVANPAQALAQGRFAPVVPAVESIGGYKPLGTVTDNFANLSQWNVTNSVASGNTVLMNPAGGIALYPPPNYSFTNTFWSLNVNQLPDSGHSLTVLVYAERTSASVQTNLGVGGFSAKMTADGGGTIYQQTVSYLPGLMNWIRVRESDGTVYWDYSADGITWVTPLSYTYSGCSGLVWVYATIGPSAGATAPVIISRFNLGPPAPTPPGRLAPYTPNRTPAIPGLSIANQKLFGPRGLPVIGQSSHSPYGGTSGAYTFAFAAGGTTTRAGTSAGTYAFSSASTGQRAPQATAAGGYGWSSTSTGAKTDRGTTSGGYTWTSAATGQRAPQATASGGFGWASASVGAKTERGTTSGGFSFAAAATGRRTPTAAASGGYGWSSSAHGTAPVTTRNGTGSGIFGWSSSATGQRTPKASATGSYGWTSTDHGTDPRLGATNGAYHWVTTASGHRIPVATTAGLYAWAATVTGYQGLAIAHADAEHTLTVAPGNRTLAVASRVNTLTVTPGSRVDVIEAGDRTIAVAPGNRTLTV